MISFNPCSDGMASESYRSGSEDRSSRVSILVLMEWLLKVQPQNSLVYFLSGFNPCSDGMASESSVQVLCSMIDFGFNPCSDGMASESDSVPLNRKACVGFNPCSDGMASESIKKKDREFASHMFQSLF